MLLVTLLLQALQQSKYPRKIKTLSVQDFSWDTPLRTECLTHLIKVPYPKVRPSYCTVEHVPMADKDKGSFPAATPTAAAAIGY